MRQSLRLCVCILVAALFGVVAFARAQDAGELQRQVLAHHRTLKQEKAKLDQAARALYDSRVKFHQRLAQQESGARKVEVAQQPTKEYKNYVAQSAKADRQLEQIRSLSVKLAKTPPQDDSVKKELAGVYQELEATLAQMQGFGQNPAISARVGAQEKSPRNRRQMAKSQFEDANQKANQYQNLLSSVLKTLNEMRSGVTRKVQ